MHFKHAPAAVSAVFDDPDLVSAAGLVPMLRLARLAELDRLVRDRLSVPSDKGANAGAKVMSLIAGMLAGADSIDDMNLLRHGGMGSLFNRTSAPSSLGICDQKPSLNSRCLASLLVGRSLDDRDRFRVHGQAQ